MTKPNAEILNAIRDWANRNYVVTNNPEDTFPRRQLYDHYKRFNPATTLSRNTFGRYFLKLFADKEGHSNTHYAGLKLLEKPDTPVPDNTEENKITVASCEGIVLPWFNDRYIWTENPDHKIPKRKIYERFKAENPDKSIPDFMVGLCLRKKCKATPTPKFWKGVISKSRVCECCGQPIPDETPGSE